jgi:hypothetical protein
LQNREYENCREYEFYYFPKETRDDLSNIINSDNNELDKILEREKAAIQAQHDQVVPSDPLTEDSYIKCDHIVVTIGEKQNKKILINYGRKSLSILFTGIIEKYKKAESYPSKILNSPSNGHDTSKSIFSDLIRRSDLFDSIRYFLKNSGIDCYIYHKNKYEILPKTIWDNEENILYLMVTSNVRHYIDGLELIGPVFVKCEEKTFFISGINEETDILFKKNIPFLFSKAGELGSVSKETVQNYGEKCLVLLASNLKDGKQELRAAEVVYIVAKILFSPEEISSINRDQANELIKALATRMNIKIIDQGKAKVAQEENYNFNYLNKQDIKSIVVLLQSLVCAIGPKKVNSALKKKLMNRIKNFAHTF